MHGGGHERTGRHALRRGTITEALATTIGCTEEDVLLQTETASFSDVSRLSQLRRCFWRCCPGLVVKRAGQDQLWLEESHEEEPLEGHSLKLG